MGDPHPEVESPPQRDGLDDFPSPVVSVDPHGHIIRWNRAATQLFGVPQDEACGLPLDEVLTLTERDASGQFPERKWAHVPDADAVPVEVTRWSTEVQGVRTDHLCVRDASGRVVVERAQDEETIALRRQARSDALTGLANRYELEDRLAALLSRPEVASRLALAVVDLDGFKPINDTYGHAVGDEVLAAVAQRIAAAVRKEDTVARLGGDEFVVLSTLPAGARATYVTERIRRALADPISTSAGSFTIGASVGIALADADSDGQDLLRRADKAMYRVKLARSAG